MLSSSFEFNSCVPLITALGFLTGIGRNKTTSNLSRLPPQISFLTLASMVHMVWQGVLLHMGTLADEASPPCSYAIWNLMSPSLLKHRKRALKGFIPAIQYFIISPHKPFFRNGHMVGSLRLLWAQKGERTVSKHWKSSAIVTVDKECSQVWKRALKTIMK